MYRRKFLPTAALPLFGDEKPVSLLLDQISSAAIPADCTQTDYPIEDHFEIPKNGAVSTSPGLGSDLINQPRFAVYRA